MKFKILLSSSLLFCILIVKIKCTNLDESSKISIIMETMLPSMFGLFSNITDADYKSSFKEPCTFDKLLEIFSKLPPYFDKIGAKFPNKTELLAYYSMQLASTFLVNNNSLSMTCLYNMLSLQTRLQTFSLDLMDNPENNMKLVGFFGIFMKPIMARLKQNAMMKIIDHVDKYEKNDNMSTITVFNVLNLNFICIGLVGIVANMVLILILRKSAQKQKKRLDAENIDTERMNHWKKLIRKKYPTRICFMIIAACHSGYVLFNYIIMSQAGLASVALKGLTKMNLACKMAFVLFPPTTGFNILHQIYAWLLVYIIRRHSIKLRETKTHNFDENADYEVNVINSDSDDDYTYTRNLNPPPRFPTNSYSTYRVPKSTSNSRRPEQKNNNITFLLLLFAALFVYNSQNLFFYSLNKLADAKTGSVISFCAFEEYYADYYTILNQYITPILNLILFGFLPLLLGGLQILFDVCYLIRTKREQMKRYMKLKEIIEWPVYAYYAVFLIAQTPNLLHQMLDLMLATSKFAFVFPLFIQMKFSNKVWLVVFEQSLIFMSCCSDLFIWLVVDRQFRELSLSEINKILLCRSWKGEDMIETNSSRSKSSSDTSVLNEESIKSQNNNQNQMPNGYESSTLTSTSSSITKKKLSSNLINNIKTSASKSASIQISNVYPYEKAPIEDHENDDLIDQVNKIEMIDEDSNEKKFNPSPFKAVHMIKHDYQNV